jgi:predicted nucleotidyltransferase component of viral defense system
MITKEELSEFAKLRNLNLGQAEVDYFQHLLLFIISSKSPSKLVFKGGTALQKGYFLERFSEDLDFSTENEIDIKGFIEKGLKDFLIDFEVETNSYLKGKNLTFRIKGPLFNGNRNSLCRIQIDLSFREKIILEPRLLRFAKTINEIPSFEIFVMEEQEILAEKIRAIYTRNKARDVYDLYFLLSKKITLNRSLINIKLEFDKIKFTKISLIKKIKEKEKIWESEMKPLLNNFVEFKEVLNKIGKELK